MIVHRDGEVSEIPVDMEGASGVIKKILIGPADGSMNIIMRKFTIKPEGNTPRHQHTHPHIVKWLSGKGKILGIKGMEREMEVGMSAFIPGSEEHQFINPYGEECSFLCIIPNPDRME